VILVRIAAPVRENERRIKTALQGLEMVLYVGTLRRKEAVPKLEHFHCVIASLEKQGGAPVRLALTLANSAEHDPEHSECRNFAHEPQDGRAAPDLDIVGMSAQAEEIERGLAAL
jgi:hypothetical protein